jgi:hypothetical protein
MLSGTINKVRSPMGLGTKSYCAGKDQKQFSCQPVSLYRIKDEHIKSHLPENVESHIS